MLQTSTGIGSAPKLLVAARLVDVLEQTGWQKKRASAILGINSSTLYRKIQRYGLEPRKDTTEERSS